MPFGKHKGERLIDVPSEYLDWLRGQAAIKFSHPALWDYIERSKKAIDQDLRRNKDL